MTDEMLDRQVTETPTTVGRALSLQCGPAALPYFHLSEIEIAIRLSIEYQSLNSPYPTTREIRPIHLASRPGRSYIIAYCLLQNEKRVFRVDRITGLLFSI